MRRQAFEEAIAQDRYDLGLRKVFADWLDDHGDPEEAAIQRAWTKDKQDSICWLEDLAQHMSGVHNWHGGVNNISYEELLAAARLYLEKGEMTPEYGALEWSNLLCDVEKEFWGHYQRATGTEVPEGQDTGFFECCM